jgi:dihydrofolate synthase / folylpolyglutamate synthase
MHEHSFVPHSGISWLNSLPPWDGNNFSPLEVPELILSRLSNPQNSYPCIHIAGTNGKGSVAHHLSSILQSEHPAAKIGLMTSPHLFQLEERAKINSAPCSTESLSKALCQVKKVCEESSVSPTYFVALTCAIFLLFQIEKVSFAVIETGMGGRYDATNLIKTPLLSVITSISMDHEAHLGNTLRKIAWNKGGIIKKDSPVLCGSLPDEAFQEIEAISVSMNSPLYSVEREGKDYLAEYEKYFPYLHGFPKSNAFIAYQAAHILDCKTPNIEQGIRSTKFQGRAELLQFNELNVLMDAAHNIDGMKELLTYVTTLVDLNKFTSVSFLLGFLARKNWEKMLAIASLEVLHLPFRPSFYWYSFSNEAVPASSLLEEFGSGIVINDLDAFFLDLTTRPSGQLCVVAGSFRMLELAYSSLKNTKL